MIFSGGDPLVLNNESIEEKLRDLRSIEHVKVIRFDTKIPVVNPYRITNEFVSMLKKYHPIYMNIHFAHPYEMHDDVITACEKLANAGVALGSHTPLLHGVNDDEEVLQYLFLKAR